MTVHLITAKMPDRRGGSVVSTKCGASIDRADDRRAEWTGWHGKVTCPECRAAMLPPSAGALTGTPFPASALFDVDDHNQEEA